MEDRLFDFEELWYLFKKKFWIIIVITAITTSLAIYRVSGLQPTYGASSKVFIGRGTELLQLYSQQEMQYYSQFLTIFSEISKIDGFFDETLKKHGINKNSIEVASSLSFSSSENTPLVTVHYSSWTNEQMEETLNAVCDELVGKIKEIMPETEPTILSKAQVYTIYPDKKRLPTIAFAVGMILSIGLILVLDYLDSRVVSKKQLEKLIPIPVLGEIPTHEREFRRGNKNVCDKQDTDVAVSGSV